MEMRPFRSAAAFESKGIIYLETHWQTTVGLSMGAEPVFAVTKDDLVGLDRAIRACLDGVRKGVPHPTDWKKVERPLFSITPFKSDRKLMAVSKLVSVAEFLGTVEMTAYRNEGTREGFRADGPPTLTCSLDEDLAAPLLQALSQATYINGKTEM